MVLKPILILAYFGLNGARADLLPGMEDITSVVNKEGTYYVSIEGSSAEEVFHGIKSDDETAVFFVPDIVRITCQSRKNCLVEMPELGIGRPSGDVYLFDDGRRHLNILYLYLTSSNDIAIKKLRKTDALCRNLHPTYIDIHGAKYLLVGRNPKGRTKASDYSVLKIKCGLNTWPSPSMIDDLEYGPLFVSLDISKHSTQ